MNTDGRVSPRLGTVPSSPFFRGAASAAMLCLLVVVPGAGQEGRSPSAAKIRERSLFDGKSLEGWKKTDFAHPGDVKVEAGLIVLPTGRPMTGITSTRKDLPRTDYELRFEAMRSAGADFFAAATFPVGDSYLTFVNGGWGGNVTGLSCLDGMDASENETNHFIKYQNKTWYTFRIQVTGEVVRCWVDDKEVVAVRHKDRQLRTRIESRACEPLGFATWDTAGALRKITLRPLTPDEIAAANKAAE